MVEIGQFDHVSMIERAPKVVLGEPGILSCLLLEKLYLSFSLVRLIAGLLGPFGPLRS